MTKRTLASRRQGWRVALGARKQPRQGRSRATVEAILEGCAQVLARHGVTGFTTARVAERAGVSVGSLYQYYPTREALLDAVVRRQNRAGREAVGGALEATRGQPFPARLAALLDAVIALKRRDPRLHRVLATELPPIDGLARKRQLAPEVRPLLERLLAEHETELGRPSTVQISCAIHAVEGVLARALEAPGLLADAALQPTLADMALHALGAAPAPRAAGKESGLRVPKRR